MKEVGVGSALLVLVLLLVLVVHLGAVMTWLMIGLAVLLGFLGLPALGILSRLRWRKTRSR